MQQFAFSLERIREWRERQLEIEEARLQRLAGEKNLAERSLVVLEQEAGESAAAVTHAGSIDASVLQAVDSFRRYAAAQRGAIARQIAGIDTRMDQQRGELMEARRKLELLNKLRTRKWSEWKREADREAEAQAAELYLAKWKQGQR